MKNEMEHRVDAGSDATQEATRKVWSAPQMTVVSIAQLTENMGGAGNDGVNTSTKS